MAHTNNTATADCERTEHLKMIVYVLPSRECPGAADNWQQVIRYNEVVHLLVILVFILLDIFICRMVYNWRRAEALEELRLVEPKDVDENLINQLRLAHGRMICTVRGYGNPLAVVTEQVMTVKRIRRVQTITSEGKDQN